MVQVQEWAEIRAMRQVEGLSIKEIARRTGHSRNTIRAALRSSEPPCYGPRAPQALEARPVQGEDPRAARQTTAQIPSQVIRELITEAGYVGGKTILDDYVRELRPVFAPPRTFQRTHYEPGRAGPVRPLGAEGARSRSATASCAAAGSSPAARATRAPAPAR